MAPIFCWITNAGDGHRWLAEFEDAAHLDSWLLCYFCAIESVERSR